MNKIIIIALCVWYSSAWSQNSENNLIRVIDKVTGGSVEMAVLISKNPDVVSRTDLKGFADFSQMVNVAQIEVRAFGYKTLNTSYTTIKKDNFIIELEASILEIDMMVVSATRWEQSTKDIPNKISVISAREVAFQNPRTAADLLGSSGEVFIQKSQQGGGSPMIRGFSANRLL